ncbi:TonB-dependent receptor [Pseudoalteromonas xiamenensis]|uniref:TonB-dependent receptor n=1 Tax=Pseudoalteromonas xiamenensis TaxID=882626 RepID=A0A975HPJ2_9GAMM|nr:TonB-dependent receptor [Pseudoalteromonas xiamenensis]QTH73315.1 TonB-dependent receptor [Pseudoalteromonas xiamenensis]
MNHKLPSKFSKALIALTVSSTLFGGVAVANTLNGHVQDTKQKNNFEGAEVVVKELNKRVVTGRDGRFYMAKLPAGRYTLEVRYVGAEPTTQTIEIRDGETTEALVLLSPTESQMEDLIVVGQRAGQAGALSRQKNADGIKSIVSADGIGQLPDQNAAEALQRLPGVFIARDQGEGRFVGIRGIDPNLNNVTINGANVPSPEAGVRSVAMDVIPSELVQSLEVSKTVTPDMDAGAIGGSIEVKSLSAFDREGQSYTFTAQAGYNEQVSETSPKLAASYSNVFELGKKSDLGIAGAVSWFKRDFGSHNMETDGGFMELELENAETGEDETFFGAEEMEQRHYLITRERLGAALNIDLHQGSKHKYYLRSLYSEFSDDEYRVRNEYKFAKGDVVSHDANSALFTNAKMDRDTKDRYEEQKILSTVLGAEHQLKDWFVEYSVGYSKSEEAEPGRLDISFAGKKLDLGYRLGGDTPSFIRSEDAHDLSRFELDEIVSENNLTEDEATTFKLDVSKDLLLSGYNAEVKFGAKYHDRDKFNDVDARVYTGGFDDVTASQFSAAVPDYSLGDFGPGLNREGLRAYFKNNQGSIELNEQESQVETQGRSYDSSETIFAAYAMLSVDIGELNVITGLRFEDTHTETAGHRVELVADDITGDTTVNVNDWSAEKDYSHWLPNLTMKYSHSDNLISRFAYTNTVARPSFSDSAAKALIETEREDDDGQVKVTREAEVGNPDLDPYEATNFDFSIEYYPGSIGVMSLGVFFKDIDNFIAVKEVQDNGQWDGFKKVLQSVNGGKAKLKGVELAYAKNWTNGLMLNANATLIDADDKLPNQSDTVANLMLGYENQTFSTRLSASYKSKAFLFEENDSDVFEAAHTQLDFSAKYYWNDQTQVYFNVTNLTDEPMHLYHGANQYNYQYETYGRSYELGLTITSF